jgi:hypothetical protein
MYEYEPVQYVNSVVSGSARVMTLALTSRGVIAHRYRYVHCTRSVRYVYWYPGTVPRYTYLSVYLSVCDYSLVASFFYFFFASSSC